MIDLTVRVLGQEDWPLYRAVRLAALEESPDALGATLDREAAADADHWRVQMAAARRLVVELDGRVCGVVSVGRFGEEPDSADLSGLWVDPSARCTGAAGRLVDTAVTLAAAEGLKRMYYWWAPRTLERSASPPVSGSESPRVAAPSSAATIPVATIPRSPSSSR